MSLYDQNKQGSVQSRGTGYGAAAPQAAYPSAAQNLTNRVAQNATQRLTNKLDFIEDTVAELQNSQQQGAWAWSYVSAWVNGTQPVPTVPSVLKMVADQASQVQALRQRVTDREEEIEAWKRVARKAVEDCGALEKRVRKLELLLPAVRTATGSAQPAPQSSGNSVRRNDFSAQKPAEQTFVPMGEQMRTSPGTQPTMDVRRTASPAVVAPSTTRQDRRAAVEVNSLGTSAAVKPILSAYGQIPKAARGLEYVDARNRFVEEYRVVGLACSNTDQRMTQPVPPIFAEEDATEAAFWAIPNGGIYIVLPQKDVSYTGSLHSYGGMKELFDSDFLDGKTYTEVTVVMPAVFRLVGKQWECVQKGQLRLR